MSKVSKEDALKYHSEGKAGKIEVIPTKPYSTQRDLSLAYTPGVAEPCLEIEQDAEKAYEYTAKGNLVAVISNGTAVLGLGDIGALAGKPVMEGKGLLFKIFAGIDVFDIEVNEKDPEKFIQTVKAISPTFGGINLEDIKAPECFEIETRLKNELDIPVMHDDQHGTAIISGAGLINALEIAGKKIEDVKIVVNGAGAASISCTKLYVMLGARKENIVMCDSKGVISTSRPDLNAAKREFATDRPIKTLQEAVVGADVFLGLSVANVLTKEMVRSMNADPIVFALANPNPEISYADAMASRDDIIFATGRSDYPNQINNVLGFPYIFRGALDTHAKAINEEMKRAAVYAIADLAKEPVPDVVNAAYKLKRTTFGRDYILPKALDPRLLTRVSCAVAKAAIDSGVSRKTITDWEGYANHLREMMGYDNKLLRSFTDMAKANPKRVVFAEANHVNMLKAAAEAKAEGICFPILLGNEERLAKIAGVDIDEFSTEMFEAGEKLDGKTPEEVFLQDFKVFMCGDIRFGVAQGSYMTRKNLLAAEALLQPYLEEARNKQNVEDIYMLLTDVPKEESVVISDGRYASEVLSDGFETQPAEDGSFTLPGVVSRKKQFIPALMTAYQEL